MDWWFLAQSALIAFVILLGAGALIAVACWVEDELGEGTVAVLLGALVVLFLTTMGVHQCRGGFDKKPAEAPQQVTQ